MTTDRVQPAGGLGVDGAAPRLPDPPPTQEQFVPRSPPVAPPVEMPSPAAPAGPAHDQGWSVETVQAVHRATNEERRSGRRGPRRPWHVRILRALVIVGGIAIAGMAVVFFAIGFRDGLRGPELPEFADERPVYGTAVYEYVEMDEHGAESTGTVTFDDSASQVHLDGVSEGERFEIRRGASATYVFTEGVWDSIEETPELVEILDESSVVPIFADFVPDAARPYTDVVERDDDVVIRGRALTMVDLLIDHDRFASSRPSAYREWVAFAGDPATAAGAERVDGTNVTLWVDAQGVVWRWESSSDVSSEAAEVELLRLGSEPFTIESPFGSAP